MYRNLLLRAVYSDTNAACGLLLKETTMNFQADLHTAASPKKIFCDSQSKRVNLKPSVTVKFIHNRVMGSCNKRVFGAIQSMMTESDEDEFHRLPVNSGAEVANENDMAPVYGEMFASFKPKMAKILIDAGADLSTIGIDVHRIDKLGRAPLHWLAICNKDDNLLDTAELMLENGADVDALDNNGMRPIDLLKRSSFSPKTRKLFSKHMNESNLFYQQKETLIETIKNKTKVVSSPEHQILESIYMDQDSEKIELAALFNEKPETVMEKEKWLRIEQTMRDIYEENEHLKKKISILEANIRASVNKCVPV